MPGASTKFNTTMLSLKNLYTSQCYNDRVMTDKISNYLAFEILHVAIEFKNYIYFVLNKVINNKNYIAVVCPSEF